MSAALWALAAGLALAAPARGLGQEPVPRVASVELVPPPGEPRDDLDRALTLHAGDRRTRAAVRASVEALYATGRCGQVTAVEAPAGAGAVRLVFTCEARRVVGAIGVRWDGQPVIGDAEVLRAAELARDDELGPGRLDAAAQAVASALARRGWRAAEVRAEARGAPRAEVELRVRPGPATLVESVALAPPAGSAPLDPGLAKGLATRPGARLDEEALRADASTLAAALRARGRLRATVGAAEVELHGTSARVRFPIVPGPLVELRFAGVRAFTPAELATQVTAGEAGVLDPPALQAAAARLRAFYVARGFAEAQVAVDERPLGDRLMVVFRVDERRRYRIREVRFEGAAPGSEAWLRGRLDEALEVLAPAVPRGPAPDVEREARAAGSPAAPRALAEPEPREVWAPALWESALARVAEEARAEGWLDATYDGVRATLDRAQGTVDVLARLRQGPRTLVAGLVVRGARAFSEEEVVQAAGLKPGDPLAAAAVEGGRAAIVGLYAAHGYAYARVEEHEELESGRPAARVVFTIDEGPQVRVGALRVSGARRTREDIVREVAGVGPGDLYVPERVAQGQAELLRLGVFRSVGLRLVDPDVAAPQKDLELSLSELPYMTVAQGIGFSIANGPRATFELTRPNLGGRALELSFRTKVNYPIPALRADEQSLSQKAPIDRVEGRGELGLRDPLFRLFGIGHGASFAAIGERLHRPAYDLARGSGIFELDVPLARPFVLTLQYEAEVDGIVKSAAARSLTLADVERLRFPEGTTVLESVRPVFALDRRDSSVHPTRGWLASATLEVVHSVEDGLFFGRPTASVSGYFPLPSQAVLALQLSAGRVVPFGSYTTSIIAPRRFFLGGAATMRGYGEDEMVPEDVRAPYLREIAACAASNGQNCSAVALALASGQTLISEGGQAFVLGKAEVRFPIYASLEAGVFADVGNLWLDPARIALGSLRLNFGAGLRFLTPIGPAVLDLGVNPDADARLGEPVLAPHFSIGLF